MPSLNPTELVLAARRRAFDAYKRLPDGPLRHAIRGVARRVERRRSSGVHVVERGGLTYRLDLSQMIDSALYYNGVFEPEIRELLRRWVPQGGAVLDIGANVGCHTLELSRLVGERGIVHAFEPTQWGFDKLTDNLNLNPSIRNVTAHRAALSDGVALNQPYHFRSQWSREDGPMQEERGYIDYLTVDSVCQDAGLTALDFIKLDVDGFETKVLRGAQETLARFRPTMVIEMSDYWQRRAGDSFGELLATLTPHGYRYYESGTYAPIRDLEARIGALVPEDALNVLCRVE